MYPQSPSSYSETILRFSCPNNEECHCEGWTADAVTQNGMTDLVNEDDSLCPECGEEGEC